MPVKKPADRKRPAKKAAAKTVSSGRTTAPAPITSAAEWGRGARDARVKGRPLTVPSGKTCLVKMLNSMQEFIARGDVPNALLPLMQEAATGKVKDEKQVTDLVLSNPEKLRDMFDMIDMVVCECVIEPPVAPVPQDDEGSVVSPHLRPDDDTLYVDYIDLEDKMFIFNYALSGASDLEQFREKSDPSVVPLHSVEGVEQSAKRHPSAG
jgi:hypothetical protein